MKFSEVWFLFYPIPLLICFLSLTLSTTFIAHPRRLRTKVKICESCFVICYLKVIVTHTTGIPKSCLMVAPHTIEYFAT